jgi:hypothetical protein
MRRAQCLLGGMPSNRAEERSHPTPPSEGRRFPRLAQAEGRFIESCEHK